MEVSEIIENLKACPGFVYQIGQSHYFLGKWICKPCTEIEITDCHAMYGMCIGAGEMNNARFYFQKLRAYSDFALEVPCNPKKVHEDLKCLISQFSSRELQSLEKQIQLFKSNLMTTA